MPAANPELDRQFMRRALELAIRGRGRVEPNPMVGCVIAQGHRIVGEGYHEEFGGPHAEPNALAACSESPAGATAYVSLEPCCHANKKTPPCVPKLIEAKLRRVVVGCLDPNPAVSGAGLEQLRRAGVEVDVPLLESEAQQLNAAFFKRMRTGRPYVTLKWAQSADGKVAGPGGKTVWISNPTSTRLVHELRARCDAILIGINTALCDDPLLTARGVEFTRPLTRAVLDSNLRLPLLSRLVQTARQAPLVVYCSRRASTRNRAAELQRHGVRVTPIDIDHSQGSLSLSQVLDDLNEATHVLVEPGPTLAQGFIAQGLADRIWVFRSIKRIDDATAPAAPKVPYPAVSTLNLDGDELSEYLNPCSPAHFADIASAEFHMALKMGIPV